MTIKKFLEVLAVTISLATAGAGAAPVDRTIAVNGLKIHYVEWGSAEKPPLVLLHGIARVAHSFDHLAPHFADRFRVIAIDMRGHGDSAWDPQGSYMVEDYTKDIAAIVRELKLKDMVLWGNSTGGRVVQMIAGQMPELVRAVIVEDVGPERPREVSNRRADRMAKEADGWATFDDLYAQAQKENPRTPEAILKPFVQHASKRRDDGRIVWKRDPAILNGFVPTELWATVKKIRAPLIYVLGGASNIVPPQTQMDIRQELKQSEIVMMPGLGHYPSDEKPAEFIAIVERFLAAQR